MHGLITMLVPREVVLTMRSYFYSNTALKNNSPRFPLAYFAESCHSGGNNAGVLTFLRNKCAKFWTCGGVGGGRIICKLIISHIDRSIKLRCTVLNFHMNTSTNLTICGLSLVNNKN